MVVKLSIASLTRLRFLGLLVISSYSDCILGLVAARFGATGLALTVAATGFFGAVLDLVDTVLDVI